MDWLLYFKIMIVRKSMFLKQHGIAAIFSSPAESLDKNAISADFNANKHIGRITIWESGECDMEILDVESGATLLWKNYLFTNEAAAELAISEFISRLSLS